MKLSSRILVLGVLCAGFVFAVPAENLYENEQKLKGLVDGLINDTINSLVANIPEPIEIDALPLNFSDSVLSGEANISDFKLSGINKLLATKIDVALLSLSMNATIIVPEVTLNTKYFADILLAELIPLYGSGSAAIVIDNIEILLRGKVAALSPLQISNVSVQIGLEAASFNLDGLLNNGDFSVLVSRVLSEYVPKVLNDNKEVIGNIISPIVQELINSLLGTQNTTALFKDIDLSSIK